jgi:hypothetical protein
MKLLLSESTGTASSQLFLLSEKFHVIPWLMIEFGFYALWTFFYFAAAVAAAVQVATRSSVAIRDVHPGSVFPSRIRTVSIPDPKSASKNVSILTQKNDF